MAWKEMMDRIMTWSHLRVSGGHRFHVIHGMSAMHVREMMTYVFFK
jgi:hypothetical protein